MRTLLRGLLGVLLLAGMVLPLQAAPLNITELAVTTKVSKGKPIDAVHRISHKTVKALYCFSRTVADDPAESSIKHVWLRDNQVVKEVDLPIKGKRWRVYSTLPVDASSIGAWRVEVRDAAGVVIKSVAFKVH